MNLFLVCSYLSPNSRRERIKCVLSRNLKSYFQNLRPILVLSVTRALNSLSSSASVSVQRRNVPDPVTIGRGRLDGRCSPVIYLTCTLTLYPLLSGSGTEQLKPITSLLQLNRNIINEVILIFV